MYQGTFPSAPSSDRSPSPDESAYRRGSWQPGELDALPAGGSTRRQWFAAMAGLFVGGAAVWGWSTTSAVAQASAVSAPEIERGTPEWALSLLDAPADELIRWSGDLDRVSARHPDDQRLVWCFDRVLDVILDGRHTVSDPSIVDVAGAAAVRSLKRLRRTDLVTTRSRRILGRRDLVETRAATERLLQAARYSTEAGK